MITFVSLLPYVVVRYMVGGIEWWHEAACADTVLGGSAMIGAGAIGASAFRGIGARIGMLVLYLASMLAGCGAPLVGSAMRTGGCGILYHLTALAAVVCYTLVGLALARSRLRLAVMAYEVKPGGMLIGLLVFAPFVIGTITAFTIGFGGIVGLIGRGLGRRPAGHHAGPATAAPLAGVLGSHLAVRGALACGAAFRFGRNGFTSDPRNRRLGKILAAVRVLFAEHLLLDEMEHHVAHVLAFPHAPFGHQRGGHRAELFEREIPEALQQLRPAHMARLAAIALGDALEREIQRVLEEKIRVRIETLVAFQDRNHGLFKLHRLHENQDAGRRRAHVKAVRSKIPQMLQASRPDAVGRPAAGTIFMPACHACFRLNRHDP